MNVIQNLTIFYNHLTPDSTYRNVCRGILGNLEEAAEGTIYDLADLTNSSRTTILRMIQKLGYETFSEFHQALKRAVKNYTYYNRILPREDCQSPEIIKSFLLQQMESAYSSVEKNLDTGALEMAAEQMYTADKVRFYVPFQISSIYSLQQNLAKTGVETGYFSLISEMIEDSMNLTEKSIVFIYMAEQTETVAFEELFIRLKEQKALIIGLVSGETRYKKYLDKEALGQVSTNAAEGIMVIMMYFYMLSEIYRMKYIDGESEKKEFII